MSNLFKFHPQLCLLQVSKVQDAEDVCSEAVYSAEIPAGPVLPHKPRQWPVRAPGCVGE